MKVVEQFLGSKKGDLSVCEDNLILSNRYIGVVDGGTDKSGLDWGGQLGGKLLSDLVKRVFETNDLPVDKIEALIRTEFGRLARGFGIDLGNKFNLPDAALVVYDSVKQLVYYVGDCKLRFVYDDGSLSEQLIPELKIDLINASLRKAVIDSFKQLGFDPFKGGFDYGREFIKPLLLKQSLLANSKQVGEWFMGIPYELVKFSIINGVDKIVFNELRVPKNVSQLIMGSDGFIELKRTLKQSLNHLKKTISIDPHRCGKYPSTKGVSQGMAYPDDISYVRLIV
ncbi:MAG: hypothetical protein WC307_02475 [Candidatus Nanoarchaeia archaeon]|jgi:hypothetical protein